MPVSGYIDTPFAESGDLTAVPDAVQVDGSVSYAQGWPILYSTPVGSGGYNIARGTMNQILNDITTAIQNWQQNTVAPFITSTMNGGSPYSYPKNAVVLYGGVIYISVANSNTDTPPSSKWAVFKPNYYDASVFTSSGTFTTDADSSASTVYRYRIISGGGGGGGADAAGTACGGGGAGAEAIGIFTGVAASTGITITIGAGGSAGSASGTNGGNGGSSSIGSPVSITCSGGGFGTGSTTANSGTFGGSGGAVTVGTPTIAAITGQRGSNGLGVSTSVMLAGNGGSTSLGGAGIGGCVGVVGNGGLSTGYGSGGGGGISTGNGGSAGQAGYILIERMTP